MKGYKKNLQEFINYVLKKYSKDVKIKEFAEIYQKQEANRERLKLKAIENPKPKYVRISLNTADTCKKLIQCEIQRANILNNYTIEFKTELLNASNELQNYTYCDTDSISLE